MTKHDERMTDGHPADDALDRLRAGSIEVSNAEYEALRAHVETCSRCRARGDLWTRVGESLDAGAREPGLAIRLRARRERALRGQAARSSGRRAAVTAFATVVVAAIAIGLGTWTYVGQEAADVRIVAAPEVRDGVPDLYADLDFYLWLLKREAADEAPNG
jgi:hypothetical protein